MSQIESEKPNLPILIHLDDNRLELDRVKHALSSASLMESFKVESFRDQRRFVERVSRDSKPAVALIDIDLGDSGISGIEIAGQIRDASPSIVILMYSGKIEAETIKACLVKGADDFIAKGENDDDLARQIFKSYCLAKLKQGNSASSSIAEGNKSTKFVGKTLQAISLRVEKILCSAVRAVHVFGESGVGKEVVADLFENCSPRMPFIRVNCAAIPANLMESELFGHTRGAFTGAISDKTGLIEQANGGWIFLDEIGELTTGAQAALLRVLSSKKELRKVGATTTKNINVRVISATNKNLEQLAKVGKFRQDLFQRLREVEIGLPPLRERKDEIEDLVAHFCQTMEGGPYTITRSAVEILKNAPWSEGNIRELENCLRAMTEYSTNKELTPLSLPHRIFASNDDFFKGNVKPTDTDIITLKISPHLGRDYNLLANQLLLEIMRGEAVDNGPLTLRGFSVFSGISRNGLQSKFTEILDAKLINREQLNCLFKRPIC